jgi:hypothetical protein
MSSPSQSLKENVVATGAANAASPLLFLKEVAKYFMDFLETDFHKRRTPKRAVRFRNADNLLTGLQLTKYSSFNSTVWKFIRSGFSNGPHDVRKGEYRTSIPKNLLELVHLQVGKISSDQVSEVLARISEDLEQIAGLQAKEYDQALSSALDSASSHIRENIVKPLLETVEKPIQNLDLGDENNLYIIEEEIVEVLVQLLSNKLSELLRLLIARQEVHTIQELAPLFELEEVQTKFNSFFDDLQVGDLFLELYEMERNRAILDKQEFYLYFCDITFDRAKYPVFYIPFSVERGAGTLKVTFDSQVYINKRALEYIAEQVNEIEGRSGSLQSTAERIIYLAQHQQDLPAILENILNELCHFFQLDKTLDLTLASIQIVRSQTVRLSNTCYVALFDKSDEALVNDYEEILQLLASGTDNPLAGAFNKLIEDFITKEPRSFNTEVEEEWDSVAPSDKLVFKSPIPLNSEQRQILAALNKEDCRYLTVEGPPGTGKSHTITAIVFESVLKDRSVLVLSDKKEALDVVEDKITDTLNQVRYDKNFQNPILRLGRTGNTYNQILSSASIENIKTHYRAVRKEFEDIADEIGKHEASLKEDIEAEIVSYGDVETGEIRELEELETCFPVDVCPVDIGEVTSTEEGPKQLEDLRNLCTRLRELLVTRSANPVVYSTLKIIGCSFESANGTFDLEKALKRATSSKTVIDKVRSGPDFGSLKVFSHFLPENLPILRGYLSRYQAEKNPVFGYLFKRARLAKLDAEFQQIFTLSIADPPHEILGLLSSAAATLTRINAEIDAVAPGQGILTAVHASLTNEDFEAAIAFLASIAVDYEYLRAHVAPSFSKTLGKLKLNFGDTRSLCDNVLTSIPEEEFNKLLRYGELRWKVNNAFASIPNVNYARGLRDIEQLATVEMTYQLDGRVIEFYENNRATAKTLREIIRTKQRFPKQEFGKLRKAFPCILAGIRDYAEYIPLEPEAFDLLIIDEASQVSVAQAFPALLRAKKVLILGDKRQFSNIKAAQARSEMNREYLSNLEGSFKTNVSREATRLVKLQKFNIRTSVLEFFEFISNYHTQLVKHFRGYKELISYSNKFFYQNSLQVMKIRGKPIEDVLQFSSVKCDAEAQKTENTNKAEVDYIISQLLKLKEQKTTFSVGIITPHTNQQKLLMESISSLPERDYYFDDLKLKIMTFDTCQGEERDLIFYSMVATAQDDRLWGVFIKDLAHVDLEEQGQIKAQRLNVGFSRAKECGHFVVSKKLEEFKGSVGEALRHYWNVLDEAKKEHTAAEVDKHSAMEPLVLTWFYQTHFWQENKDHVELIPQFEIGRYLKQLDKTYSHPLYRVDFLLVCHMSPGQDRKIIIEYDGFHEHFEDLPFVGASNYQEYYSEDHVYRQKVLESYGYRFVRINKFNVGANPIETLDQRLREAVSPERRQSPTIATIHSSIEGLQNGEMKECPKCKNLRRIEEFKDSYLTSGFGRFCQQCKSMKGGTRRTRATATKKPLTTQQGPNPCPKCGAKMMLRRGRYGQFYGCSKYPYCKGTRQLSGAVGWR